MAVGQEGSAEIKEVTASHVVHWNGRSWRVVGAPLAALNDVAGTAYDDLWAVGSNPDTGRATVMHYSCAGA
jgi:hypothetical protein